MRNHLFCLLRSPSPKPSVREVTLWEIAVIDEPFLHGGAEPRGAACGRVSLGDTNRDLADGLVQFPDLKI